MAPAPLWLVRRYPYGFAGFFALVVVLLARSGHATLLHAHDDEGLHVHLLPVAQAAPDALAAWHAHHAHGGPNEESGAEHVHGRAQHDDGLLLPPLSVLAPALPLRGSVVLPPVAFGPWAGIAFTPVRAGPAWPTVARERAPPAGCATGLTAVLRRNHSIRI